MDQNLLDGEFCESGVNVDIPLKKTNNEGEIPKHDMNAGTHKRSKAFLNGVHGTVCMLM